MLQEEILSRRAIVFGVHELSWNCVTSIASEAEPDMKQLRISRWGVSGAIAAQKNALRHLIYQPTTDEIRSDFGAWNWQQIIEDYTSRRLTYSTDKVAAMAGVADALQKSTNNVYYAGIWKHWLVEGLMWMYYGRDLKSSRHPMSIAPTWSWASVTGPVEFSQSGLGPDAQGNTLVKVEDVNMGGTSSRQSGRVTVTGHVWKTRLVCVVEEQQKNKLLPRYRIALEDGSVLYPDEMLTLGEDIWQIAIARQAYSSSRGIRVFSLALVVNKVETGDEYRRVGFIIPPESLEAQKVKEYPPSTIMIV